MTHASTTDLSLTLDGRCMNVRKATRHGQLSMMSEPQLNHPAVVRDYRSMKSRLQYPPKEAQNAADNL